MSTAGVVGFTQSIVNLNSAGFIGLLTTIPKLIAGVISLTATFGASEVAALGLKGVLDLLKIDPVVLAISALIAVVGAGVIAYNHFNVSLEEHKKALDDAKSEYSSTTSELESLNDQLKTTQDRLSELSGKGSLTVTEQGEYDKLVKTNDELERQIQLKDAIAKNAQKQVEQEAINTLNSNGYYDSKFGLTTYGSDDFWGSVGSKVDAITAAQNYGNVIKTLDQQISDLNQKYDDGKISEEAYLKQSKTLASDRTTAMGSYGNVIQDIQSEIESLNGDTTEEKNIISSANDVIDKYTSLTRTAANATSGFGEALSDASDAAGALQEKSTLDILDSLKDKYEILKQAQEDVNDTGYVSASTLDTLLSKYPELSGYLVETSDGYKLTKNSLDNFVASQRQQYQLSFNSAQSAAQSIVNAEALKKNGFDTTTMSIKQQLLAMEQLYGTQMLQKRQSLAESLRAQNPNISSQDLAGNLYASDQEYIKLIDKARTAASNITTAQSNLDKFKSALGTVQRSSAGSSSSKGSSSSSKNETELYVADIDKLYSGKEKLVEIQNEIKRLSSINDITDSDVEKVQNLNQIIILYKQEQDALHALNQERRNEISAQVDTLKSQGFDVLYDPDSNKLVINNLEHINKLQGKTTEETNEIRKAAEKLIDTVQSENSDAIQSSQDWLGVLKNINGAYNDIKQSAKDALEESQKGLEDDINSIKSTVNKAFDEISKLLSKEKESYETQKSNLESVASTVTSYINTYTDSLQSENDELEKQISLQQKLEALDKAKTQRNKRIFKSGKGFIWGADESAVNSAQEEYDSALKEYNLNKQIQELKDYAKAWQDAVNSYETSTNEALTASILGSNWRSKVLGTNYSLVKNFKGDYTSVLSELDDSVYGSVAYQIKNLDNLKDEWSNAVDEAEDTSTDYKTVLDLVKTYESSNYSDRLNEMSKFVTSMKEQYKELTAAYQTVTAAIPTATSGSIQYDKDENYAQKILDSTTLSEAQAYAALRNAKISGENITGVASTQYFLDQWKPRSSSSSYSSSSTSSSSSSGSKASSVAKTVISAVGNVVSTISKNLFGFSEGGIVDDTGIAMLHGGNGHNEVVLNSNSADNVWKYIQSGDALANSAAMLMLANKISLGDNLAPNADQNINLNIGDIYLSGVDDSSGLANDIVKRLPAQILQKLHRR